MKYRSLILLALVLPSAAQEHSFFDRGGKAALVGTLGMEAADAWATHRNSELTRFTELDPVARPFVTRGTPALAGYFAVDAGLKIGTAYVLHRLHHHKLERIYEVLGIADSTAGVTVSAFGYKSYP